MKRKDYIILGIAVFTMSALLLRILYVDDVCEEVVDKHIGDTIPRTIEVNSRGNYLTGDCSYRMVSQRIEVK